MLVSGLKTSPKESHIVSWAATILAVSSTYTYDEDDNGDDDDEDFEDLEASDEDHCQEVAWEDVLCVLHARQYLSPWWLSEWGMTNLIVMMTILANTSCSRDFWLINMNVENSLWIVKIKYWYWKSKIDNENEICIWNIKIDKEIWYLTKLNMNKETFLG